VACSRAAVSDGAYFVDGVSEVGDGVRVPRPSGALDDDRRQVTPREGFIAGLVCLLEDKPYPFFVLLCEKRERDRSTHVTHDAQKYLDHGLD
jgi:hypothetical protein